MSERDIVQALADGRDPDTTRAEDIMTLDLAVAAPNESMLAVASRMLDNEIRHVPVTEDGVVVGMVSDVMRCACSSTSGHERRGEIAMVTLSIIKADTGGFVGHTPCTRR